MIATTINTERLRKLERLYERVTDVMRGGPAELAPFYPWLGPCNWEGLELFDNVGRPPDTTPLYNALWAMYAAAERARRIRLQDVLDRHGYLIDQAYAEQF